jgi:hypothetical protein
MHSAEEHDGHPISDLYRLTRTSCQNQHGVSPGILTFTSRSRFPSSEIPFQAIVERVADGTCKSGARKVV